MKIIEMKTVKTFDRITGFTGCEKGFIRSYPVIPSKRFSGLSESGERYELNY